MSIRSVFARVGAYCFSALVLFAVLFAVSTPAHADDDRYFNNLVIFGDSLLDSGNVVVTVPGVGALTLVFTDPSDGVIAPGEVVSDYFAEDLGITTATPFRDGGSNYAVAGSHAEHIYAAVTTYVGNNPIDDKSIILIGGGANNLTVAATIVASVATSVVLELVSNGVALTTAEVAGAAAGAAAAITYLGGVATTMNMALGALAASGAKYIIVNNIPDVSQTPGTYASVCGTVYSSPSSTCAAALPTAEAAARGLSDGFNTLLTTGFAQLRADGANLIVADIKGLFAHVLENPVAYGYTLTADELTQTCYGYDPDPRIYPGNDPECATSPKHGRGTAGGDPAQLLFADNVHPTQKLHELEADYLYDIVYAPTEIALLPEIGIYNVRHQINGVMHQLRPAAAEDTADNPMRDCFADVSINRDGLAENGPAAQGEINATNFSVGCDQTIGEQYRIGFAANLAQGNLDISNRDSEYDLSSVGLAAYIGFTNAPLFINTALAVSRADIDADRVYRIGGGRFNAKGKTDSTAWGAEVSGGYDLFSERDNFMLAPALAWSYRKSRVDGYRENGNGHSNYIWDELENESRQYRAGLAAAYSTESRLHLSAEAFYTKEQNSNLQHVNITQASDSVNRYRLPGFKRNDEAFVQLHLGVTRDLANDGALTAAWNYSGQGDGAHGFHAGFRYPF